MEAALLVVGVLDLGILGIGAGILKYCMQIESRLTRVETLIGG